MADEEFNPFPIFEQPKQPVYDALLKLNLAFESIAFQIERLDDDEIVPLETLRLYRMQAETLRSGINHRVLGVLLLREERDWALFGKQADEVAEELKNARKPDESGQ
ncbi:MAG TPA: hypothetical protein VKY85_16590 [Candidatus Angelobacter sp.]|nr:hypothetical protein [Candidatus Angelobacter sp.]